MDILQIILLSLVQGVTEFLPISSSAHLILAPYLFGYSDQGLAFDIAVHVGSLGAVILYFRREVIKIITSMLCHCDQSSYQDRKLGWYIIIATLPIIVVGLLFQQHVATDLRSPFVIAITTVGFGLLLMTADLNASRSRDEFSLSWVDALIIGLFQSFAIVPGTSRSGVTMMAGLMLGLTREAATRFSFLLSIPTILLSGLMGGLKLWSSDQPLHNGDLLTGIVLSFIAAYLCIHFFLKFIERIGMLSFVVYRLLLGILLFWMLV